MKNVTKRAVASLLVSAMTLGATPGFAASWLEIEGQVNFDVSASEKGNWERNLRTQDDEITLSLLITKGIKIVVQTELERALIIANNGVQSDAFNIEKFIEDAYIQIETDKFGMPRAIITAGKHDMAFGQNATKMPMFKDNLLYSLTNEREVIGLTVGLPANFFGLVDKAAFSVFETGAGDLALSNGVGGTMKLKKEVTEQLSLTLSAMLKQNQPGQSWTDSEKRGAVGVVFDAGMGWTIYAEGVVYDKNPQIPDSTLAGTVGATLEAGPGTVVVEYSYLQDVAHEVAAAYNLPVGKNLVLSPEVRHRMDLHGSELTDTRVGIRARIMFNNKQKEERALIGG